MALMPDYRAFLPVCLLLGALFCAPPTRADTPAAPGAVQAQRLVLRHVVPEEIVKALHWDQRAHLPPGVTDITSLPVSSSLLVQATPAGLAEVRELVKLLDIAPRPVQIRMALARVTEADLKASGIDFALFSFPAAPRTRTGYAAGKDVARFAEALQRRGAVVQSSGIFTFNNKEANLSLSGGQPIPALPNVETFSFAVTPRVNSDDTLTLALCPKMSWRAVGKANPPGLLARNQSWDLETLRTLRSGDTLVITNLFVGATGVKGDQLLLFVTPTLMPGEDGPPTPVK